MTIDDRPKVETVGGTPRRVYEPFHRNLAFRLATLFPNAQIRQTNDDNPNGSELWYAPFTSMVREAFVMKKMVLGFAAFVLISLPVLAALKVGDMAPNFSARGSLGGKEFDFSLQEALKKGPVVVYFFPSAYTKGCDLEAHTF